MKSYQRVARRGRRMAIAVRRFARYRRGTVIIIVLALLGMLAFAGIFALAITSSENQSATYFAGAASVNTVAGADPSAYFNDILRQIIIGPSIAERQSALWGGTKSLLPTMFGRDLAPYNGQGINVIWNSTANQPAVDQDYSNTPDPTPSGAPPNYQTLLQLNLSPAAQGVLNPTNLTNALVDLNNFPPPISPATQSTPFPDPDTNTTYPDINSAFLSYDALVPNGTNAPVRVVIPSFHRPQLLRNATANAGGGNVTPSQWYTDKNTAALVVHPHAEHLAMDNNGNLATPTTQRFVTNAYPDYSGIGTPLYPFAMPGDNAAPPAPPSGSPSSVVQAPQYVQPTVQEGIWSNGTLPGDPINYGVDTDNDGVPDAFYIDFGLPIMTTPDGSQKYVALAAVKIIDLDSLFNLNVHGNRASTLALGSGAPVPWGPNGTAQMISMSDQGISASEINPEWALNARPAVGSLDLASGTTAAQLQAAMQQHTLFFRTPANSGTLPTNDHSANNFELANMEWWNVLNGRPQLTPSSTPTSTWPTVGGSSLAGRWGENTTRLDPAVLNIIAGSSPVAAGPGTNDPFPLPGTSGADDNNDNLEGGPYNDEQAILHPPFVHPIDFFATGTSFTGTQGKVRALIAPGAQSSTLYSKFPLYSFFLMNWLPVYNGTTTPTTAWPTFFNSSTSFTGPLMSDQSGPPPAAGNLSGGVKQLIDEPDETVTEPSEVAKQPNDSIFGPGEIALQLSSADFAALGNPARTASLMPFNFASNLNLRAAQIRQRFTSTSWDLKSFGKEFLGAYSATNDSRRLWEFTPQTDSNGKVWYQFPPSFGSSPIIAPPASPTTIPVASKYPFRTALANLLQIAANPNSATTTFQGTNLPQRLMSINGLTEQIQATDPATGNTFYTFRVRPLTPHPLGLTSATTLASTPIQSFPTPLVSDSTVPVVVPTVSFTTVPEQLGMSPASPSQQYLQQQEWLARYDRQRLARDIYVMLYTFGGGNDSVNYATTSNAAVSGVRPLYTDEQLREMAQFAVNTVDALDPDDHVTLFEYDKNLADGWGLDDNPYDGGDAVGASLAAGDRGIVYGIERQRLALNETMILYAQRCMNVSLPTPAPQDHPDTQIDDTKPRTFFFTELENVGPDAVSFQNQGWQIAVKESPTVTLANPAGSGFYNTSSTDPHGEMRLTFTSTQPPIPAGNNTVTGAIPRMTIGGTGDADNVDPTSSTLLPSWLVVNPNHSDATYGGTAWDMQAAPTNPKKVGFPIIPRAAYPVTLPATTPPAVPYPTGSGLDLDLIQLSQTSNYYVMPPGSTPPPSGYSWASSAAGDGQPMPGTSTLAPGASLLQFNDPTFTIGQNTAITLRVELRRRADLNRLPPLPTDSNNLLESLDNPWIVVDYIDVPVSVLALRITGNNSDFSQQIQYQLGSTTAPTAPASGGSYGSYSSPAYPAKSTERSQPLYNFVPANGTQMPPNGGKTTLLAPVWQANSFGQNNDPQNVVVPHSLWQPHYDRDFTSVAELFDVPLYGPYGPPISSTTGLATGTDSGTGSDSIPSSPNWGLAYRMASRNGDTGTGIVAVPATIPASPGTTSTETLVGGDWNTVAATYTNPPQVAGHSLSFGTAGYRMLHPEGTGTYVAPPASPATSDPTVNRWYRLLGLVEVPTRSHRGLEENAIIPIAPYQTSAGNLGGSLGFYRTPGKINVNTLRYPEIVAGLVNETDILTLQYTPVAVPMYVPIPPATTSTNLSIPYLLQDASADTVAAASPQMPTVTSSAVRDWWEQFIAARDGIDPLPTINGGTGLSLPGTPRMPPVTAPSIPAPTPPTPGSHPFRGLGFSANGGMDANGYNGPLESTILRTLPGDVTSAPPAVDNRRRLFELGTAGDHTANVVDYATKNRILSRLIGNTTTRSNVFLVWIQVDFFQAKDISTTSPQTGIIRIGAKLGSTVVTGSPPVSTIVPGTSPGYRAIYVIDRSQALGLVNQQSLPVTDPNTGKFVFSFNQSFNWQSLILYTQRIQ